MARRRCSFVIPAYNEARRLPATLAAIAEFTASRRLRCEIVVVDDGSTDATTHVARSFRAQHCRVRVLRLAHRGKGFAIRRGICLARGEIIYLCDADLHESVGEVVRLEAAIRGGADIAIGSRWLNRFDSVPAQPLYRCISSRLFNLLTGGILGLPYKDTQCGLKALTRQAAAQVFPLLRLDGWGYDSELIHVALTLDLRVEEVGLRLVHEYRDSRFRPIADGWATFLELFKIRRNDMLGAYGRRARGTVTTLQSVASSTSTAHEDAA